VPAEEATRAKFLLEKAMRDAFAETFPGAEQLGLPGSSKAASATIGRRSKDEGWTPGRARSGGCPALPRYSAGQDHIRAISPSTAPSKMERKVMRSLEPMLVCRSCGRRQPESYFTLGLKCIACAERDAFRKQRVTEMNIARAEIRADSKWK
jgi:hypothetical protein